MKSTSRSMTRRSIRSIVRMKSSPKSSSHHGFLRRAVASESGPTGSPDARAARGGACRGGSEGGGTGVETGGAGVDVGGMGVVAGGTGDE